MNPADFCLAFPDSSSNAIGLFSVPAIVPVSLPDFPYLKNTSAGVVGVYMAANDSAPDDNSGELVVRWYTCWQDGC